MAWERGRLVSGKQQKLKDVPHLHTNHFYLLAIENKWKTEASKAFDDNKETFSYELGANMLVEVSDTTDLDELRDKFKTKIQQEPAIIITQKHPNLINHWLVYKGNSF